MKRFDRVGACHRQGSLKRLEVLRDRLVMTEDLGEVPPVVGPTAEVLDDGSFNLPVLRTDIVVERNRKNLPKRATSFEGLSFIAGVLVGTSLFNILSSTRFQRPKYSRLFEIPTRVQSVNIIIHGAI